MSYKLRYGMIQHSSHIETYGVMTFHYIHDVLQPSPLFKSLEHSIISKGKLVLIKYALPIRLSSLPLATTGLHSVSMDLSALNIL